MHPLYIGNNVRENKNKHVAIFHKTGKLTLPGKETLYFLKLWDVSEISPNTTVVRWYKNPI